MATLNLKTSGNTYNRDAQNTFNGAIEIVQATLRRAGYTPDDFFELKPIQQVRWKADATFKCIAVEHHTIRVRVKPSDNSTAWEYALTPPSSFSPAAVLSRLQHLDREPERKLETQSTHAVVEAAGMAPGTVDTTPTMMSWMTRLGQLTSAAGRIQDRKNKAHLLDKRKLELQNEIASLHQEISRLDGEILDVMREDEEDKEAQDAVSLIETLERLLPGNNGAKS